MRRPTLTLAATLGLTLPVVAGCAMVGPRPAVADHRMTGPEPARSARDAVPDAIMLRDQTGSFYRDTPVP